MQTLHTTEVAPYSAQFATSNPDRAQPKREVAVSLYLGSHKTLPGTLHCDPDTADDVAGIRQLFASPEPYLRFSGRFGEFFMISAANVEAVLLTGQNTALPTMARCFVTTRSGHTLVGGIGGDMTTDRLSDVVQEPWLRFYTDIGLMLVNSQHVQYIKSGSNPS